MKVNQSKVTTVTDICSVVIIGGKMQKTTLSNKSVRAFDSGNYLKMDF